MIPIQSFDRSTSFEEGYLAFEAFFTSNRMIGSSMDDSVDVF